MALLKKKEFETFYLKNISGGDPTPQEITQTQLLIGSSEKADIYLNDSTVNHYHAVITSVNGVMFITDLYSTNGTVVNGKTVRNAQLGVGDLIELGNAKLEFGETLTENQIIDTNKRLKIVRDNLTEAIVPPVRGLPKLSVEKQENPNLYYVDGEYCDIKFDESKHKNANQIILDNDILNARAYIEEEDREYFPILKEDEEFTSQRSIEIVFVTRGNIMSYDIIPEENWKKADNYLSDELYSYIEFSRKKERLIKFEGSKITITTPQGFSNIGKDTNEVVLTNDNEIILEKGVHQIFIRFGKTVSKTQHVPWLWRDKGEAKRVAQKFMVFFLPFLLLTLVSIEDIKEEKKNIVVIYKKKMKKEKKQSLASDSKLNDSAKKEEAKKIAKDVSDISNKKKVKKVENKKVAKKTNKKNRKIAKNKAKSSEKRKVAKKTRPQLKLAANFSKMLGSSQVKSKSFASSSSSSSSATSSMALANGSTLKTVGGGRSINGLGRSSKYGNGKGYKSNGLGKSGFDSNFTSTKTVVLGSIDPDILRRLLREHIPQFRYCYQEELGRNKRLKGIIDLDFTINKGGKISSAKVIAKNGKFSKRGTGCIKNVLKKIPFPKPKGGGYVEVRQPLNFSSDKTKV